MAGINGLKGYVTPTTAALIAAYGNDMVNVGTGMGYGLNLNTNFSVEFENFLQLLFFQNYSDPPRTFNGTTWSKANVGRIPLSKYIKLFKGQLYLGYVSLNGTEYPSRIWRSDPPRNNALTWGYEYGSNLSTIAGNGLVASANAGFLANNIKRGDPFYITSGGAAGEYRVLTVAADQQIILQDIYPFLAPQVSSTGASYWVGGNWIDFDRDDGDFLTGLAENTYQLIVFKRDSLHRFDGTNPEKIRGAPGTTSPRSIANLHELTIYFYGGIGNRTGFYAYDGRESIKISGAIEEYIQGISGSNYASIIGFGEGELYRAYVGNISNTNKNIMVANAVVTWDYNTKTWSVDPIAHRIVAATEFRQTSTKQAYFGTNTNEIMVTPSGYDFNGTPIAWKTNTKIVYPNGTENINTFSRVQILSENANGIQVKYKLHLTPFDTDTQFSGLGQISKERTELDIPERHNQASGIELQFVGSSTQEPTPLIKKITIMSVKESSIIK